MRRRAQLHVAEAESAQGVAADDDFWESFGDIRRVEDRLTGLPTSLVATLTPWGASIALDERSGFANLLADGGYVHVAVVLPEGHGARAARRRADRILAWFAEKHAAEWRARGFGEPRRDGEERIVRQGQERWAVRIRLALPTGSSEVASLAWAAERATIEAPRDGS